MHLLSRILGGRCEVSQSKQESLEFLFPNPNPNIC